MAVAVTASKDAIAELDERYLSVCLDLGQVAEPTRFWNPDGTGEIVDCATFDFDRPVLRNMTAALAPAFLRIGGTEADRVHYALDPSEPIAPPKPFKSTLTAAHLDAIGDFATATGLDVCFTLNAGWGARTSSGEWTSDRARALMRYVKRRRHPFTVFELGNEPNAYPLFHNGLVVEPETYAADVRELARLRDDECPAARIAAPSTAWWPNLGEVDTLVFWPPRRIKRYLARVLGALDKGVAAPRLDIVTWHYYPGLSTRSALAKYRDTVAYAAAALVAASASAVAGIVDVGRTAATALALCAVLVTALATLVRRAVRPVSAASLRQPANLDTAVELGQQVLSLVRGSEVSAKAAVWLGETGSAQVGGEPEVSGRWATALWWLDQLGALALVGHQVQCRQTLSGSDYGLIDAAGGKLTGTPDYWASVLWKRLMGPQVLKVSAPGAPSTLRIYCHRPPKSFGGASSRSSVFLAINLGPLPEELDVGGPAIVWVLSGARPDARTVTINGQLAETNADGTVPELPGMPCRELPVVPPRSALFALVPDWKR